MLLERMLAAARAADNGRSPGSARVAVAKTQLAEEHQLSL
jgi:hypothetical protein